MSAIDIDAIEGNDQYGLVAPEEMVIIRAYGDDGDDQLLNELRPRFIVMYDPNQDFVRRIEVSNRPRVPRTSLCFRSTEDVIQDLVFESILWYTT
jgi:hypothetical protein